MCCGRLTEPKLHTAISSLLGKIPTLEEYQEYMVDLNTMSDEVFRYMNFNEIEEYLKKVREMDISHLDIEEIKNYSIV